MGKRDNKTRRGKIWRGTYGVSRRRKRRKISSTPTEVKIINETLSNLNIEKITIAARGHQTKQICYNCRKEFNAKDMTKEHIPAKNLFEGYSEKYKVNRITVPAYSECNGKYSPTDEEFRNMIGIIAKRKENNDIAEKAVKSILRKETGMQRLTVDNLGKVSGVSFDQTPIEDFHKKNFKGLFYHQYGTILPKDYELYVNIDEKDWSDFTLGMLGYLKELFTWKHSGHPDILSYVIEPFRIGISNPSKKDLMPQKDENIFVGFLEYNKEHAALVIVVRKGYIENIKKQKTEK